jgi:hypothetical protein
MSIVWTEETPSREAQIFRLGKRAKSSIERNFFVSGTTSDLAVHAYANTYLTTNRLYSIPPYVFLVDHYRLAHLGADAWKVTAVFESLGTDAESQPVRKRQRTFDTTGATKHITNAISENRYAAPGETAPDMKGAINVRDDDVAGVDVPARQLSWTETYDVPNFTLTWDYVKLLRTMTGKVNLQPFRTFAAGEVMFLGATGSHQWDDERGNSPISLMYKFLAGENLVSQSVGDVQFVTKGAHDYLWIVYRDDTTSDHRFKVPLYVYVDRVAEDGDFSTLGIGTT